METLESEGIGVGWIEVRGVSAMSLKISLNPSHLFFRAVCEFSATSSSKSRHTHCILHTAHYTAGAGKMSGNLGFTWAGWAALHHPGLA